jgi:hypothetical protein
LRRRVSQVLHIVPVSTEVADAVVLGVPLGHAGADWEMRNTAAAG